MRKILPIVVAVLSIALLSGCGIRRNKYETKIDNNSQQPDKTLFDRAVNDIEKSRYEVARLTLQTLINTYPDSEYLAKAKLAIADAWYRQGGTAGLAQAEAEYKDFITFFPNMPEAGEAQLKVAMIHYQQMEKPDRDATHARRAEDEFKQLLLQFPDSPFKEEAEQRLREVQEVLAQHEFSVGRQYYTKTNYRAAVPRLRDLTANYPNFSEADQALWLMGQCYEHGKGLRDKSAAAYAKIISDYPLSPLVDKAKEKLTAWKMPIPEANAEAYARMKYDIEHRQEKGLLGRTWGIFNHHPDVTMASQSGQPVLVTPPPTEEQPQAAPNAEPGAISIQVQSVPTSTDPAQPPAVQPGTPQPAPVAPQQQAPQAAPQAPAPAAPAVPKAAADAPSSGNDVQVAADTKTSTDAASDNSQNQLTTGRERKQKKSKKDKEKDKEKDKKKDQGK